MQAAPGVDLGDLDADFGDPATFDSGPPFAVWDRMRAAAAVQRSRSAALGIGFWSVTGWREIRAVAADDATFVSGYGMFLGFGPDSPDPASQRMMVVTDGPHRRALRGAMQRFFSPGRVGEHAERLTGIFRSALHARLDDPTLDFAQEVAWRVPMAAVCQLLDLPEDDHRVLGELTNQVLSAQDPTIPRDTAAALAGSARAGIATYFSDLAEQRRRAPGQDVVSALVGEVAGGPLPPADVLLNLLSILVAGNETTRLALTGGLVAFAEHPDQWARLRADPALRKTAVDEILRWTAAALHITRTAAADTELAGARIAAGDVLCLLLPAGNRDPEAFADPHVFDVGRTGNAHLTFGYGPHHCIGAALARIEIAALLDALIPMVGGIEVSGPLRYTHSHYLNGYVHAPLRLRPA